MKFLPWKLAQAVSRGKWQPAPHLIYASNYLVQVCRGKLPRLQLNFPPRHGKTHLCGHHLPFYYLSIFPDRRVMYVGHSEGSAHEHGAAARDIVQEFGQLTGIGVRRTASAALDWQVVDQHGRATGGGMRALGVGSAIHGKGADLVILDDLFGNIQDVLSQAYRDTVWRWLGGSLLTRLSNVAAVVSIGTPFHSDDHFGRFQQAEEVGGDRWTRVRLPAIAGVGDPLGRTEGAALWPEMFPLGRLEQIRRNLVAANNYRDWAAQYMLTPIAGDGMSEWPAEYFDGMCVDYTPPEWALRVLALDPSKGKDAKTGDFAAWTDIKLTKDKHLYAWADLKRVPTDQVEDYTVALIKANNYHGILVEANGFQELVARNILAKCTAQGIRCPIYAHINTINKTVRIRMGLTPLLAQRRIRLVPSPGRTLFLNQLRAFPHDHDDGPDSLEMGTQILNELLTGQTTSGKLTPVGARG